MSPSALSIVMPVFDEAERMAVALAALAPLRERDGAELIVVDGGSRDASVARCAGLADRVIAAPRGRARQMNAGAAAARGDALLFLHADTALPPGAPAAIADALSGHAWGRFDVRIDSPRRLLRVVAAMMNLRSRWSGIATGDQALFVRHELFERVGGFPELPLMEDVAISRRLKRHGQPACLRARVTTSGRRWDRQGAGALAKLPHEKEDDQRGAA